VRMANIFSGLTVRGGRADVDAHIGRGVAAGADCVGGGLDVYPVDASSSVMEHRGALGSGVALR
jgi:hypothetical protein